VIVVWNFENMKVYRSYFNGEPKRKVTGRFLALLIVKLPPNTACRRLEVRAAFFGHFSGFGFFPFRQ
jgi:hypothetical protein